MKVIVILLLIFLTSSITKVNAIKCYQCTATINCRSKDTECSEDQDVCQKKTNGKIIEKSCTNGRACLEDKKKCKNGTCEVFCCRDDYCNTSTSLYVNGLHVGILATLMALIGAVIYFNTS